jgi:hypothetical protein
MNSQAFSLSSIVWMICFVLVFDRLHRRKCHYRRLWAMYRCITGATAA